MSDAIDMANRVLVGVTRGGQGDVLNHDIGLCLSSTRSDTELELVSW